MHRTIAPFLALILALVTAAALIVAATTVRTTPVSLASIEAAEETGGAVVAHAECDPNNGTASSQPLIEMTIDRLPAVPTVVEVNRVTIPPGALLSGLIGPGPELLLLETGSLAVQVTGSARGAGPSGSGSVTGEVTRRPGDILVVPTGAPFAIENRGRVAAVLLEVALRSTVERSAENEGIDASALDPAGLSPGVSVQRLAEGLVTDLTAGPATIAVARLTLTPGAEVTQREVGESELVAFESGSSDLTIAAGQGQLRLTTGVEPFAAPAIGASGGELWGRERTLAAGEGAFFPRNSAYAIRNSGTAPLVYLLVSVTSAGVEGG